MSHKHNSRFGTASKGQRVLYTAAIVACLVLGGVAVLRGEVGTFVVCLMFLLIFVPFRIGGKALHVSKYIFLVLSLLAPLIMMGLENAGGMQDRNTTNQGSMLVVSESQSYYEWSVILFGAFLWAALSQREQRISSECTEDLDGAKS